MVLNAYTVWLDGDEPHQSIIHAPTAAKARADYFRHISELFESPREIWCKLRSKRLNNLKEDRELDRLAKARNVPAKINMRCEVAGENGYIAGANNGYILVYFMEGKNKGQTLPCHPTWEFKYFDDEGKEIEISHD